VVWESVLVVGEDLDKVRSNRSWVYLVVDREDRSHSWVDGTISLSISIMSSSWGYGFCSLGVEDAVGRSE
jgi:hypothetical protein